MHKCKVRQAASPAKPEPSTVSHAEPCAADGCAGQTLLEFTIALAMMLSIVFALVVFLSAFSEYGWRILTLVGLKYP